MAEAEKKLLRVVGFSVQGLFGLYDHTVPLKTADRVTILHGPNGVGKTALLELLDGILSGQFEKPSDFRFDSFTIDFNDHSQLRVGRTATGKYELHWNDRSGEAVVSAPVHSAEKTIRSLVRVHMIEVQRLLMRERKPVKPDPDAALQANIIWSRVYQLHVPDKEWTPAVTMCAQELPEEVSEVTLAYLRESQALERSFPERLLKANLVQQTIKNDELKAEMQALEERQRKLQAIGLLEATTTYPFDVASIDDLDAPHRNVLWLHVQDTKKKLDVLTHIATRIELLLKYINGKFTDKKLFFDGKKGLVVRAGEVEVPLDRLSSGEQHELVLLYDLLFRVAPNTLVLIDEPELSLHIEWQRHVLPELLEIAKTADIDIVVATHSPFIVGDRTDLMVSLDKPETKPAAA